MEYLQYNVFEIHQPAIITEVLNLIINGIPSIQNNLVKLANGQLF